VPIPGTTLKLVSAGDKLEVRVKGPNVTPGYWKAPELTAKAFDEDGFYLIGDAVKFVDVDHPDLGLLFDGRIAEDFKLISGTWVNVGNLRVAGISALAPLVQDIVVAEHGGDEVRFLLLPNVEACRIVADAAVGTPAPDILRNEKVRAAVAKGLAGLKASGVGSSTYATRAIFLAEPPSVDGGEITDKGYINQRAMLARRTIDLAKLNGDDDTVWIGLVTSHATS
jgi:feruloyl-CoA synthase